MYKLTISKDNPFCRKVVAHYILKHNPELKSEIEKEVDRWIDNNNSKEFRQYIASDVFTLYHYQLGISKMVEDFLQDKGPQNNVIFLDIDGVLNTDKTNSFLCGEAVLEDDKLLLLKQLAEETHCKIVLISTKKMYWQKDNKDKQSVYGNYLDKKFSEFGLSIFDKTEDNGFDRWFGIISWKVTNEVENYIILDDNEEGYEAITKEFYLVKVSSKKGLTEQDVERAKKILYRKSLA